MAEHTIEYVIRLTAPQKWNENSFGIVCRVLNKESQPARLAASTMAENWTKNGEPVHFETEIRMVTK